MNTLYWLVTITDRPTTDAFLKLYKSFGVDVSLRTVGAVSYTHLEDGEDGTHGAEGHEAEAVVRCMAVGADGRHTDAH